MIDDLLQTKSELEDKIHTQRGVLSTAAKNNNLTGEGLVSLALKIVKAESELAMVRNTIILMRRDEQ